MYPNIVNNASLEFLAIHRNPLDDIEFAQVPAVQVEHVLLNSYNEIVGNVNVNVIEPMLLLTGKTLMNIRLGDLYHAAIIVAFMSTIMITTNLVRTQTAAFWKNANEFRKKEIVALKTRLEEQRAKMQGSAAEPKKEDRKQKQKSKQKPTYKQQQLNIANAVVPRCPKRGNRRRIIDTIVLPNTKTTDVLNAIVHGVYAACGTLDIVKYSPATSSFELQTADNVALACSFAINIYSNSTTVNSSGRQKTHNHVVEFRRLNGNLVNCFHATESLYPALNNLIDATQNANQINTRSMNT